MCPPGAPPCCRPCLTIATTHLLPLHVHPAAHPAVPPALLSNVPPCCACCACSARVKIFATLETTERIYSHDNPGHMCINDGYVCFYNSHLIR